MGDDTYTSRSPLSKLGTVRYNEWEKSMFGRLMSLGVIGIVEGTEVPIAKPVGTKDASPKAEDIALYNAYSNRCYKAAGEIYMWLDDGNKIHVDQVRTSPKEMWDKLKEVHSKSAPNSRFNSLSDLLSIRLKDDETLSEMCTRIQGAMLKVKSLRPASGYDINTLDDEIMIMAMIRALPREEYSSFISSVLLLTKLDKDSVLQAFRTEETQRKGAQDEVEAVAAAAARNAKCFICDGDHLMNQCPKYEKVRAMGKDNDSNASKRGKRGGRRGGGRGGGSGGATAAAAQAKSDSTSGIEDGCDGPAVEGKSAVCNSVNSRQPSTDFSWNADTGASASMTPHREWFRADYKPWRVPVRVANGAVVYSVGKGSVLFQPTLVPSARKLRPVIITEVLHVPSLANNLLSVLTLTSERGFSVQISKHRFDFKQAGELAFTASVDPSKTAYLDGHVISAKSAYPTALRAAIIDRTLIHRRMCHLGKGRLEQLIKHNLSSDLVLNSDSPLPDICEACINGKQHRHPFLSSTEQSSELLDRIFSDLKGPMPVKSYYGHLYFAVFVDDASRYLEVYELARKKDLFEAFKLFKALVEKQTGRRIRCFHNDEGGEYTLKALIDFCKSEGIRIEFTTRATPQSNGVAERSIRTISEAVIAMNTEAKLPPSFWNFALNVYRHVHNRTPTAALPSNLTPYEAFRKKKPKIGHLRVYGCRAFVLIGRDKRKSLQGHTVKGIFIGYPKNHVGWNIYIPETRKIITSRDVIFNESEFPGISTKSSPLLSPAPSPNDFAHLDDLSDTVPYDSDDMPPPIPVPVPLPDTVGAPTSAPVTVPAPETLPRRSTRTKNAAKGIDTEYYEALQRQEANRKIAADERALRQLQKSDAHAIPPVAPGVEPHITAPAPTTPPVNTPSEPLWDVSVGPTDADGNQLVDFNVNLVSEEALIWAGRAFVEHSVDFGGYGQIAVNLAQHTAMKVGAHDTNPRTYREAVNSEHASDWYTAMAEEMNNHKENGTWTPVYLPAGAKTIGTRWVFKVKHLPDGAIDRFKARIVAQGFSQRPGVDFEETYAPTARWPAVRAILALAAMEDLELESVDVTAAFLNSNADAELYIRLPDGADHTVPPNIAREPGDGPIVGRLNKGMYGLKQGAYLWHKRLNEVFLSIGFVRVVSDPCVYVYLRDDVKIIIPVHVDDMTLASKSRPAILKVIDELRSHFKLRHLGPTVGLLGVRVIRDRKEGWLTLDQRAYEVEMLARFGMLNCKPLTTPMDPNRKLRKSDGASTPEEQDVMAKIPYIQATGALLYLALCTRPDIAYTVGVLCRFNSNPGLTHWAAVKHLFRYIKGTLDYRIKYSAAAALPGPQLFRTYSDADHGGNLDTGKSTTGSIILMAGGAVDWISKIQSIIAMSTTESEFVAASETGRSLCWMRNFLDEIGFPQRGPSDLLLDNQSAISVSKHPEHMGKLKHLDRHYFWLRDAVYTGKIHTVYIPTTEMIADLLTKALSRDMVDKLRRMMGIVGEWSHTSPEASL